MWALEAPALNVSSGIIPRAGRVGIVGLCFLLIPAKVYFESLVFPSPHTPQLNTDYSNTIKVKFNFLYAT